MKMQRGRLERPDGGVVELPRHVPGNVLDAEAHDLVGDAAAAPRHPLGDERVDGRGLDSVGLDGLEVEDLAGQWHRAPLRGSPVEVHQQPAFASRAVVRLVHQLAPEVGAHVLERARVPDARRHLVLYVVVPERDVAPLVRRQLLEAERCPAVLGGAPVEWENAFDLPVQHQHPLTLVPLRPERRPGAAHQRLVRHGEDAEVERRIHQPPCLVARHVDAQLLEEPQDRAGLGGPRRVVIAGDQHDRRLGQRLAQPLELAEREDDGGVGRADGVEQVAGHDDGVGARRDDAVDRQRGRRARCRPRAD